MTFITPPSREESIVEKTDGDTRLVCRRELEGSDLVAALASPESLAEFDGLDLIKEHTNLLATVALPGTAGLPERGFLKAFGGRGLFSRFRRPRALRAWEAGCRLMALGVPTPEPLALSLPGDGRWRQGILVVEHTGGVELREFLEAIRMGIDLPGGRDREKFIAALGSFVRTVHDAGVFHGDLGGGNILVTEGPGGETGFQLVDVTRCAFRGAVGRLERLADLGRVKLGGEARSGLVEAYSAVEPAIEGLAWQDRLFHRIYRAKVDAKGFLRRAAKRIRGRRRRR